MSYRPIVVPAFTRDPDEECLCIECYATLVREGNKLVCPNGCDYEVLILKPLERTYCKSCGIGVACPDYDPPDGWCTSIHAKNVTAKSDTKRLKELEAICKDCDEDPEDRDGDPCEYCRTWKEIKEIKARQSDIKRRTEEEKVCDEDCANCPVRYECPDSPYEHSIENTEKRIEP